MKIALQDKYYYARKRILTDWTKLARDYCDPHSSVNFGEFILRTLEIIDELPTIESSDLRDDSPKELFTFAAQIIELKNKPAKILGAWLAAMTIACTPESLETLLVSAEPVPLSRKIMDPAASPQQLMAQIASRLSEFAESYDIIDRRSVLQELAAASERRKAALQAPALGS